MSATAAGYQDGQRTTNWTDLEPAWSLTSNLGASQASPVFFAARAGYLSVLLQLNSSRAQLAIAQFADQAGAVSLGITDWDLDTVIGSAFNLSVPILGPYAKLTFSPWPGHGNASVALNAYLTNAGRSRELLGVNAPLIARSPLLAAGGNEVSAARSYATGPCGVFVDGGSQGVSVNFAYLDTAFVYDEFAGYSVAAGATDYRIVVWPAHATQLTITNLSLANPNNTCRVVVVQEV